MDPRILKYGVDARGAAFSGVEKLSKMVVVTMGPKGRTVLIERGGNQPPYATKDGVSVAREIFLKDPFENMGAQLVKEAAEKTNDAAGDGTTTATLLAYAIIREGLEHVKAGKNAILVKRGIDYAVSEIVEFLDKMKKVVDHRDQYKSIATISAQDDRVGEMISDIIHEVGQDGVVTVEHGSGFGLEKEHVEGMQFDGGYISPYFVIDAQKMECPMEDVPVLLTDTAITTNEQILPILNKLSQTKQKKLLIIAENVSADALATLVVNKMKGSFLAPCVRAPSFGQKRIEFLMDLAALTGGTVISETLGKKIEDAELEDLGRVRKAVVGKNQTTLIEGRGTQEEIEKRKGEIRSQIEVACRPGDIEKLQSRLAKLSGGVGVIKVGAATEFEQKELQHRVEDALSAVKAAVEEGIVPGGGIAYIRAKEALMDQVIEELHNDEEKLGAQIVFNALPSCFSSIVENAGFDVENSLRKVSDKDVSFGFNAATGEYGDMYDMQIINPKKVERSALENAASVASMFLTLEGAIADEPKSVTEEQK